MRRIAIFTLIQEKRMLLQHRDAHPKYRPNMWGFFGGGIEQGETPEKAVIREAHEELQISLIPQFFGRYTVAQSPDGGPSRELFVFVAPLTIQLDQLRKQQKEGDGLGLHSIEEIRHLELMWDDKAILEDIAAGRKTNLKDLQPPTQ
ncbi:NUDIX domain-containing protein [Candidatus Woesearchaeota archaeon]|nr:NUDIX domain-containing protein [Candidatus Woesearchaeota archaeon]